MRLPLLFFFVLAIYLGARSAECDIDFTIDYTITTEKYQDFIKDVRAALTVNSPGSAYNIPELPATASGSSRFILLHLTNYESNTITLALDPVNVYVIAYRTGSQSYFLGDAPAEAYEQLFQGTTKKTLPYSGNYNGLESAAGTSRENVRLGMSELSSAIGTLFYYQATSVPKAFLVLIQVISEAARFYYIEDIVSQHIYTNFTPDPKFLSLETSWSDLSEQIQIAKKYNGLFLTVIRINDVDGSVLYVTSVNSPVVKQDIALLLYYKVAVAASHDVGDGNMMLNVIRMPVDSTSKPCNSASNCGLTHRKSLGNGGFKVTQNLYGADILVI